MRKVAFAALALTAWLAACSSSMSLAEYAEKTERLVTTMNERLDQFDDQMLADPSLELTKVAAADRIAARTEFVEQFAELRPPDEVSDLHATALDIMTRLAEAESVLADMVADAESLEEIDQIWSTPEGLAAQAIDAEAVAICTAAQEGFDATADRSQFQDLPWIPPEMREVVRVTFRCGRDDS